MNEPKYTIAVIKGDGIGVDVTNATMAVVSAARDRIGGFQLKLNELLAGAGYFKETGQDVAPNTEAAAGEADAIFLGAIGLPSIRHTDGTEISPHLRLREMFQLYAGVRPIKAYPNAPQRLADPRGAEIDLIVLRESTEGLFYSAAVHNRCPVDNDNEVQDIMRITRPTTERLHDFAFKLATKRKARGRKGHVTCVDKAIVFRSMAFFRQIFDERAAAFPEITKDYNYVDATALDLIRRPWEFDVMVMENMFGDIITDEASMLAGSMGILPSASLGEGGRGLYEPIHGSAPDIAGKGIANPLGTILSAAMALRHSLDLHSEAAALEAAVGATLDDGVFTADLAAGGDSVDTEQAGSAVIARLRV